jgi:hypothetical protein
MSNAHFQIQIGRLSERWRGTYVPSLIELIWREVKELPDSWLTKTIDDLIGNSRQAPLLPDFRERISLERERGWRSEKEQYVREAKELFRGTLLPEEQNIIFQTIVKRVNGRLSDQDWSCFLKGLDLLAKTPTSNF